MMVQECCVEMDGTRVLCGDYGTRDLCGDDGTRVLCGDDSTLLLSIQLHLIYRVYTTNL